MPKEVLSTLVSEDGKTPEQYREDYRLHFSVLAKSRLERMAIWFKETDETFKAILREYGHLSDAEQEVISKPD